MPRTVEKAATRTTCFIDALDAFIASSSVSVEGSPDVEQDEANLRNQLLFLQHGSIPQYAWFRAIDIERESIATRVKWWSTFGIYPHNCETGFRDLRKFLARE